MRKYFKHITLIILIILLILLCSSKIVKANSKAEVFPADIIEYFLKNHRDDVVGTTSSRDSSVDFVGDFWKKEYRKYREETGKDIDIPYELTEQKLNSLVSGCAYENYYCYKSENKQNRTKNNIPVGATVYFDFESGTIMCSCNHTDKKPNHKKGFVGIYLGNNEILHLWKYSKIKISTMKFLKENGYKYVDWYYYNGMKPNNLAAIEENSTLKVNVTSYPKNISMGSNYKVTGEVVSNFAITSVTWIIYKGEKQIDINTERRYTNRYNINNSFLFSRLNFKDLEPGNYELCIWAKDITGKREFFKKNFSVYRVPSTLKINLTKYPQNNPAHTEGKGFGLRGNITSNYPISSVRGYVWDVEDDEKMALVPKDDEKIVLESKDFPNSKTLDIQYANLNNSLKFGDLEPGKYILEIKAHDLSNKILVIRKEFTVVSSKKTNNVVTGTVDIPSTWNNLSIRTGPSTNYKIIGSMKDGVKCTVYTNKTKNGWYYIDYKGTKGYVAGNRVDL